jgi:hypothetical protein
MAGYTLTNLKDVEDEAPKFGLSPGLEARFPRDQLESEHLALSYQKLAPSFRMPFGHRQREQEEMYVVVGGSGRAKLGDEVVELRQWDVLRVAKDTMRSFEAGPQGAELIAIGAPKTGIGDAEMTPGWWSD